MFMLRAVIRRASTFFRPEDVRLGGAALDMSPVSRVKTGETRTYSPPSSDSGGGSGCSSCGGGSSCSSCGGGSSCSSCGGGGSSSF